MPSCRGSYTYEKAWSEVGRVFVGNGVRRNTNCRGKNPVLSYRGLLKIARFKRRLCCPQNVLFSFFWFRRLPTVYSTAVFHSRFHPSRRFRVPQTFSGNPRRLFFFCEIKQPLTLIKKQPYTTVLIEKQPHATILMEKCLN